MEHNVSNEVADLIERDGDRKSEREGKGFKKCFKFLGREFTRWDRSRPVFPGLGLLLYLFERYFVYKFGARGEAGWGSR